MIGFYNYTVVLTYIGLLFGIYGMFQAFEGNIFVAIVCLMAAGACDMFDGKIASTRKRTREEKKFGIQIDSLCDSFSFGVLPSVIGYNLGMKEGYFMPVLLAFPLAAVIRLGYFNVMEEERTKDTEEERKVCLGLPVTPVAIILPILYCFRKFFGENFVNVYGVALLIIAVLFLLKFEIKKLQTKQLVVMLGIGMVVIGMLITWY